MGVYYLLQSDGGRQWGVVELGALWLWVKALWWLLGATEPGARSVNGPAGSGSCTEHVFIVGLATGVPWTGGDGHGEPRGDTLEGGKPEKDRFPFKKKKIKCKRIRLFAKLHTQDNILKCKVLLYTHTWSSQWFAVEVVGGDRNSTGGRHGATLWDGHHQWVVPWFTGLI